MIRIFGLMRFVAVFFAFYVFSVSDSPAQLRLSPKAMLHMSADSIADFFRANRVEYGFVAWKSSSGWPATEEHVYGLLRQKDKWYLAELISPNSFKLSEHRAVYLRQTAVAKRPAHALLRELKVRRAFRYGPEQISALPGEIRYTEGDASIILGGPSDFNYWNILDFSKKRVRSLKVYAPDWFLENFLPYEPAFAILRPMAFTHSALIARVKAALPD